MFKLYISIYIFPPLIDSHSIILTVVPFNILDNGKIHFN